MTVDAAGDFGTTRAGVIVSPGWINSGRTVIGFDTIDVQLYWEAGTPGFRIVPSSYQRGNTFLPFEGVVEPPREWQDAWSFRVLSRGARIGPSDVPGRPLPWRRSWPRGAWTWTPRRFISTS